MSLPVAIATIVALDVVLVVILALVMTSARLLTPHASPVRADATPAQPAEAARQRARALRRRPARVASGAGAR